MTQPSQVEQMIGVMKQVMKDVMYRDLGRLQESVDHLTKKTEELIAVAETSARAAEIVERRIERAIRIQRKYKR